MRVVAVICNAILVAFTCTVVAADGMPEQPSDVALTLLLLAVPLLTLLVLLRSGLRGGWLGGPAAGSAEPAHGATLARRAALAANALMLATSCWALVTRYPQHPKEEGLLAFAVTIVVVPVLNLVVLARLGGRERVEPHAAAPGAA